MIDVSCRPQINLFTAARIAELESGQSKGTWQFKLEKRSPASCFEASGDESESDLDRLYLLAAIRGLEELDQPSRVRLVTDGLNFVHSVQFGLPQWRQAGWMWERFGELVPITDRDLWQRFDRAAQCHQLSCRFLRACSFARQPLDTPVEIEPSKSAPAASAKKASTATRTSGWLQAAAAWARRLSRVASSIAPV